MNAEFNTLIVADTTPNTIAEDRKAQLTDNPRETADNGRGFLDAKREEAAAMAHGVDGACAIVCRNDQLEKLDAAFDKLGKRARKLGLDAPTVAVQSQFGAFFTYRGRDEKRHLAFTGFSIVVILGAEVRLPGDWSLIAVIDHTVSSHGNIIRNVPGCDVEVPEEYRTAAPTCDHCGTVRRRNETFVLVNNDGKIKRVGRNCIRDFLGHGAPSNIASRALWAGELAGTIEEDWEDLEGYGTREFLGYAIERFFVAVAALILTDGWLPRSRAYYDDATADRASRACWDVMGKAWTTATKGDAYRVACALRDNGEAIQTLATDSLEWARVQDGTSDYCHNVRIACSEEYVSSKTAGIVASAVQSYIRHLDRESERKLSDTIKGDAWIGNAGDKFGRKLTAKDRKAGKAAYPAIEGTILRINYIDTDWGETTIVTVVTTEGQIVKWFASNFDDDEFDRGNKVSIVATVKKQSEWNGKKETVLSRCVMTRLD